MNETSVSRTAAATFHGVKLEFIQNFKSVAFKKFGVFIRIHAENGNRTLAQQFSDSGWVLAQRDQCLLDSASRGHFQRFWFAGQYAAIGRFQFNPLYADHWPAPVL